VRWQGSGVRSTRRGVLSMRNSFVQHVPAPRDVADWVRKFDRHKKLNDEVKNVHGSLSWSDKAENISGCSTLRIIRRLSKVHRSR
jgi:hypothetical protein